MKEMINGAKGYALLLIIKQFTKFQLLLPFAASVNGLGSIYSTNHINSVCNHMI